MYISYIYICKDAHVYRCNRYQRVEYNKGNFHFDQEVKSQHFLHKGFSFRSRQIIFKSCCLKALFNYR